MNAEIDSSGMVPLIYSRIAGVLYLIIIIVGLWNELFVKNNLIVSGDPTVTAMNISAAEQLWRFSFVGSILMLMCAIPLTLILYVLLISVNRNIALLAVFFNLVSISIEGLNNLNLFAVIFPLDSSVYLNVFEPQQLQLLAYQSLRMHTVGYNISLIFFGMTCFFWGYLMFRSKFFPRVLGILLMICCACYVANSFAWFLAPKLAASLLPGILIPCFIAEVFVCLWLLLKGVHVLRWREASKVNSNHNLIT